MFRRSSLLSCWPGSHVVIDWDLPRRPVQEWSTASAPHYSMNRPFVQHHRPVVLLLSLPLPKYSSPGLGMLASPIGCAMQLLPRLTLPRPPASKSALLVQFPSQPSSYSLKPSLHSPSFRRYISLSLSTLASSIRIQQANTSFLPSFSFAYMNTCIMNTTATHPM